MVHDVKVARLGGRAVVNFGELARKQEESGPSNQPARAQLLPEAGEDPAEPISSLAPVGGQAPTAPLVASPSPTLSFMGLDDIPMVDSSYIVIPPDVGGAVGLTRVMDGHNNNYRIFNKSNGAVVSTLGTATFWAPSGETALNGLTDPRTLYDPYNNRWIAVMQSVTTGAGDILVGVSQTSDPAGSWFLYRFATGATIDFPNVGFNKNWIAVSINRYSNAGLFQRGITLIVNYPLARAGTGSGVMVTQAASTHFCTSPCATYSSTSDTLYLVTHLTSSTGTYALDTITGTPSAPVYTAGGTQTRPGGGWVQPGGNLLPQSAPNSGTSTCGATPCPIETQDSQVRSAPVYRGGFIYYAQTVGLPSSGLAHTAVQWTKLTTPSGSFADGGRIEDATATATNGGKWYVYPHIAVNSAGDFLVGYSQFSSAQHPAAGYSMHLAADAPGTIRDPVIYKAGEDYYHKTFSTATGRNRWGDFSAAQVDPSDDQTLWTLQEYAKNRVNTDDGNTGSNGSRWSNYWASVAGAAPTVTIAAGPSQNEGNSGLTPFTFTVNLSAAASQPVTVNYHTVDGTATVADNDYQAASSSITIPVGSSSGPITVNVVGDTKVEPNETFTVTLTGATNGVLGSPVTSTATILNDDTYTITATAGANGSISPSGAVSVAPGGSQAFTIAPNGCYHVADVLVDGASVGPVPSYNFTAVSANHTIAASFALDTFTITSSAGAGGSITPIGPVSVGCGADQTFSILPDGSHTIADVLVNGASVGPVGSFTFTNVTGPQTIAASFAANPVVSAGNIPYSGMSPGGVDMATGEIIIVCRPDLALDGPMPVAFSRYYGSMLARQGLASGHLGPNWLGTYDWTLSISGTNATLVTNRGAVIRFAQNTGGTWDLVSPTYAKVRMEEEVVPFYRITNPLDRRVYVFDGTSHLLTQILDEHGNALSLTYTGGLLSQVSDGLGRSLSFSYDGTGELAMVGDGTRSVGFGYAGGLLTGVTDAAGHAWTYAYVSGGSIPALLTGVTEPLVNTPITQTYDASGRVATQMDALGHISSYTYGAPTGNVYADALGNPWTYQHNAQDELVSLLDPGSGPTSYAYDASGRLSSITRPMGDLTSFSYDPASGYPSQIGFADGSAVNWGYGSHLVGGATLFDLSTAHYPDGTTETFGRDGSGNLTSFIDRGGFPWGGTYNARGQVLTRTNPTGGVTTFTYDPQGRPATGKDNAGNTTQFAYDGLSRLTQETWPDLTSRSFAYDALDHVTSLTDERGKLWSYGYDADGRLLSSTNPLLETRGRVYDGLDRVVQDVDPLGHARVYAFDPAGRLQSITDRTGRMTSYQHDPLGRLTGIMDPAGGTSTIGYDGDSRVVSAQDPLGHATGFTPNQMDRVTHVTDPVGTGFDYAYDAMGRLLSASGPLGHTETFTYDPRGFLASYFDATSETDLPRTALGEVSQLTDPNRHGWTRSYDPQGRLTGTADPLGRAASYSYDPLSRVTHVGLPLGSMDLAYDAAGRVTGESYSDGTSFTYGYDDANRLTNATGATFAYDAAGRMTGSNGFGMTYDNDGRLLSETLGPGKVVSYSYDSRGLPSQVMDWMGGTTGFTYDAAHRLTGITRPNGTSATYQYDAADRLTSAVESQPGPIQLSSISITRDALGQAAAIDRRQPLMPGATTPATTDFSYDAASQISGLSHDALGRLLSDGSRSFEWDAASRLKHYAAGADSPSFSYDAFGSALSSTQGNQTVQQAWNYGHNPPTNDDMQVSVPSRFHWYVRAPSGLLLYSVDGSTGERRFYHYDESGNAMFLTNDGGSVVAEYSYGPYGGVTGLGETQDNPFTYGAGAGMMALGSSGLWAVADGTYDDRTMRVISGNTAASGPVEADPGPLQTNWADPGPINSPGSWVMQDPGPINSPGSWVMTKPGPIQAPGASVMIVPHWRLLDPGPLSVAGSGPSRLVREQAGTLIHELGHTFGLNHGGVDPGPIQSPGASVMSKPGPVQAPGAPVMGNPGPIQAPGESVMIVPHWPLVDPGPINDWAMPYLQGN